MTKPPELKPCPFCGSENLYVHTNIEESDVFCPECETNGPVHNSDAEAIAAWNTRTPDPAVLALVDAAREVYRISERDHVAWRKLSEALAAFDKT